MTLLSLYDLSHLQFDVSRNHVGQYQNADGRVTCVAPLAARKQLAKFIGSVDDVRARCRLSRCSPRARQVPPNWAVCEGTPPPLRSEPDYK